jgi:hypothetical protein
MPAMINQLFLITFLVLLMPNQAYANENVMERNFTKIKIFSPWGFPGPIVNSSLAITHQEEGACWTGSLANPRPDAWRCSTKDRIYDPCFSDGNNVGDKVVCIHDPWAKKANLITLTKALPNEQANSNDYLNHDPWAVELFDGIRCVYDLTGTIPVIAGIPSSATCFNQSNQLIAVSAFNLFDRKMPVWLVFVQSGSNSLFLEQVPIKVAWY